MRKFDYLLGYGTVTARAKNACVREARRRRMHGQTLHQGSRLKVRRPDPNVKAKATLGRWIQLIVDSFMSSRTSSSSSQQQGIDFRDAVAILSARSPHSSSSHEHHHHPTECHHAPISIDMKRMGQVIEVSTDPSSTNNDTKKALEEEQRVHQKKLHTTMSTMSVRELLQTVLEAQQQRVESYRTYNQ